jgi:hypothetical protein
LIRIVIACAAVVLSLAATRPAAAYSLRYLEPGERAAMLNLCLRLHGQDRSLCRQVVDDAQLIANDKRSCLHAMTLLLKGSAWATVKSLPPALTCRAGLTRAGYPVHSILRRLNGGT